MTGVLKIRKPFPAAETQRDDNDRRIEPTAAGFEDGGSNYAPRNMDHL